MPPAEQNRARWDRRAIAEGATCSRGRGGLPPRRLPPPAAPPAPPSAAVSAPVPIAWRRACDAPWRTTELEPAQRAAQGRRGPRTRCPRPPPCASRRSARTGRPRVSAAPPGASAGRPPSGCGRVPPTRCSGRARCTPGCRW
ncbi:hypothetical protein [Actinacidiphila sp. bgisy167]|uniref:hypothetical protein n=1 Tax=Actinacidiphila sp. bgisy167 TaxID=3413797 RepID=UPI003D74F796